MPYLTPENNPTNLVCRVLLVPDDVDWLGIVNGALLELTYSWNWEKYGAVDVDECIRRFSETCEHVAYDNAVCRVVGEIIPYAGPSSPNSDWLVCDGRSLLRDDYPDLFAVIGTVYGSVNGTEFNIPDLRSRVVIGVGQSLPLSDYVLGAAGGEETHTLSIAETPSHTHVDAGHTHVDGNATAVVGAAITGVPIPSAVPSVGVTGSGFANLSSSGSGNAHNNIQPYIVLNHLIVAV